MAMNDAAKWYNAVVRDCGLSAKTFQLSQGAMVVGLDSTSLWNILDSVPPESFENYNPAQGNVFSTNYGAIINSLRDDDFLIQQAVATWNNAGGFTSMKAFDKGIADLNDERDKAPGRNVVMDVDSESPDLRNAWTQACTDRPVQLFRSLQELSGGATGPPLGVQSVAGSVVEVQFTHLFTFAAGPLAKVNQLNPEIKSYKPWYNSAVLKLALADLDAWKIPDRWPSYFNPQQGSMLRCCTSLVVVDGVKTVTRPARSRAASFTASATAGFWPFSTPPGKISRQPVLADGGVTLESKVGNPLILGVNVQALSEVLGATSTRPASITVKNSGGFFARFSVSYKQNLQTIFEQSDNINIETSLTIHIPPDAGDIILKIEEMYLPVPEKWSTVFTTIFAKPVDKSFELYGTTLDAKCRELPL